MKNVAVHLLIENNRWRKSEINAQHNDSEAGSASPPSKGIQK